MTELRPADMALSGRQGDMRGDIISAPLLIKKNRDCILKDKQTSALYVACLVLLKSSVRGLKWQQ